VSDPRDSILRPNGPLLAIVLAVFSHSAINSAAGTTLVDQANPKRLSRAYGVARQEHLKRPALAHQRASASGCRRSQGSGPAWTSG